MSLACPLCGQVLTQEEKRALCPAGHSFDRARQGYLNLLMDQSARGHGDDKAMLLARRDFLEEGHYAPLLKALCDILHRRFPAEGVLVDAGCGEGWYFRGILRELASAGKRVDGYAFDVARDGARLAAGRRVGDETYFVASAFRIPMLTACADGVLSLFSPFAEEEYARILKKDGLLIRAFPEREHLMELKRAVYDQPVENVARADVSRLWETVEEKRVQYRLCLSREQVKRLFAMTPYAHKTSPRDREKLEELEELEVGLDFGVQVLCKKG